MLERRNSARQPLPLKVRETNGDYFYNWAARDLSEEGIFLSSRVCFSTQEPFSKLTFCLPGGEELRDVTARVVREARKGASTGCALEFMNLSEDQRMALARYLLSNAS